VLEVQWRSTAGDERWRRVVIPGEGPVNMGKHGACEHRGSAGMLSPNLIWSETEQKVMIDGGVDLGLLPAAMATGVPRARAMEGGEGGAGSLQEDDVVLMMSLVGVGRLCIGGSAGGRAAAEGRARWHYGPAVLVEKNGIGSLDELRWVTAMLLVRWIGDWGAAVGLPTVTRDSGGDWVTGGDRSRRDQVNCACANARARVLRALGVPGVQKRMWCANRS
jgi:hypothetical protein